MHKTKQILLKVKKINITDNLLQVIQKKILWKVEKRV